MTSHAASLGSLPTSLPSVEGTALIFRLPDSTLATPIFVYPQEAPCASWAIWRCILQGTFHFQNRRHTTGCHQNAAFCRRCRHRRCQYTKCHSHCNYSYLSVFLIFIIKTFQLNSFYEFVTNLLHHDIDYSLHLLLCQPIPDISYIFPLLL